MDLVTETTPVEQFTSRDALVAEMKNTADEIKRVSSKAEIHAEDEEYLERLAARFDELEAREKHLRRQELVRRVDTATGARTLVTEPMGGSVDLDDDPVGEPRSIGAGARRDKFRDPWNLTEVRSYNRTPDEVGNELRSRAFDAIEKLSGANDKRREAMTRIIEDWDTPTGKLSRQMLATSSPEYMSAWTKLARGKGSTLTGEEQRAMSLVDTSGGYLVPFQLDPTVIITSDGSFNEIRKAARQVIATGDVWHGVSSAAVSWEWLGEGAEADDKSTTFAQPSVAVHKATGFVPITFEALQDEQNVTVEVGRLLADGKENLEAVAFATGTGSGQPFGIVTALVASSPTVVVGATTNNAFVAGDVYKLDSALPARYRARASWLANRSIYNTIRNFDTNGGAQMWERIGAGMPSQLLGRPAYEAEAMDGIIATGDDYVLIYGDFDNYVIADRIGTTVEFVPHLFHTNANRPSGTRGWLAWYRTGADSVNDGAFRLLKV